MPSNGVGGEPVTKGGGTLNCDTLFAFKVHAVHLGTDIVLTTDLVTSEAAFIGGSSGRLPREWL